MTPIISEYNPDGVDEAALTGTGRGGLLSDGYLRDDPIESYVGDGERTVFVLTNEKKGVSRGHLEGQKAGETEWMRPGDGYRAFAVVTDSRLYFLIGDNRDGSGDYAASVPLADVEVVAAESGLLATELAVTTAADVRWGFPCRRSVDDVVAYLDEASMTWMDVERRLEAARERVVDATDGIEGHAHDEAIAAVRSAMAETDAARRRERELAGDGVAAIASRVERMEERITDVHVRVLEARATHEMDRAERHWRDGDYEPAHDAFTDAHDDFVEALAVGDHDFGDSETLRERLARVERNLAALERAPVERADEFRERAFDADDPTERADLIERALGSYRTALALDWGRSAKRFAGDTARIRDRVDAMARELVETRRRHAARLVREADECADRGDGDEAVERYRRARDTLERAADPARELVPSALEAVTEHLAAVERRLDERDRRRPTDAGVEPAIDDAATDGDDSQTPLYSPT